MSENSNNIEVKEEVKSNKPQKTKTEKILFIIGIVLLVIMVPILILDAVLLIKSAANPNEVPSIFGSKPLVIMSESMQEISSEEALMKQETARNTLEDPTFIWTTNTPIKKHDLIFVKESDINEYLSDKTSDDLEAVNKELVGKTIAFKYPEPNGGWSVVVHRIAKVEVSNDTESGFSVRTYGIHNPSVDNWTVDPGVIIGEYHGSRIGGIGSLVEFLQTWYGILIFVGVPVGAIIIFDVLTSKQQAKKEAEEKNKEVTDELERLRKLNEELQNKLENKEDDKKEE